MTGASLLLGALGTAWGGFTALALAMDRHHRDSYGGEPAPRRVAWLRVLGTAGLLASLLASLQRQGATQGWVLWCGVLTAAALAVVLGQCYWARRTAALGLAAGAGGVLLALAGLLRM
jgi:hypothetical protein